MISKTTNPVSLKNTLIFIRNVMAYYEKPFTDHGLIDIWVNALSGYSEDELKGAFFSYTLSDRHSLAPRSPSDIIFWIISNRRSKWLDADEAWVKSLVARNERETVEWTKESSEAFAIAKPLIDEGDLVGARMAFRSAYTRLVDQSVDLGQQPVVFRSLGWSDSKASHGDKCSGISDVVRLLACQMQEENNEERKSSLLLHLQDMRQAVERTKSRSDAIRERAGTERRARLELSTQLKVRAAAQSSFFDGALL